MASPHGHTTTTYTNNTIDGNAIAILGPVHGNIDFSNRLDGSAQHQCLRDLHVTDPRDDRARIEGDKDRLLKDCYTWILDDASFKRWRTQDSSRLLWIRGDPGKGKTMMTMGLIAELSQEDRFSPVSRIQAKRPKLTSDAYLLTYFFCQSIDSKLNNAVSVLRGLIYMLVTQREQLIQHVQKRYQVEGSTLFEGPNAIYALRGILSNILNDLDLPTTYILIDALDECTTGLSTLLGIITDDNISRRSRVKWLVTSRNLPQIERYLHPDSAGVKVSLEVNANQVSKAVESFIDFKVQGLATLKKYDAELQGRVQQLLHDKAEGTFLWVSLVCKELESVPLYRTRQVLEAMPAGLSPLYDRMMAHILAQDVETAEYCKDILRAVTVAFRPLHLRAFVAVAGLPSDPFNTPQAVADLVSHCGSFLTIRRDTVFFIHLSAKDYLTSGNGRQVSNAAEAEEHGRVTYRPWVDEKQTHRALAASCIGVMSTSLKRDICGACAPGVLVADIESSQVEQCLPPEVQYACLYWVQHLQKSGDQVYGNGLVHKFLQVHLLHWLEALSWMREIFEGILAITSLESIASTRDSPSLCEFIHDMKRFALYSRLGIEQAPLQIYCSALVFAPERSLVRKQFEGQMPCWVQRLPDVQKNWGPLLQTLEGHSSFVNYVAFSPDGKQLASAFDMTVRLWDATTGAALHTLEVHRDPMDHWIAAVAFSPDGKMVVSTSDGSTGGMVHFWDAATGAVLQTLEIHTDTAEAMALSLDTKIVASGFEDGTIRFWDITGAPLRTLEVRTDLAETMVFSPDSGETRQMLENYTGWLTSVTFSPDGKMVALERFDNTVRLSDADTGMTQWTLKGHNDDVSTVAFSPDGKQLASASHDKTVRLWNAATGAALKTLEGHTSSVEAVAFSPDGKIVASASNDFTVRLWDAATGMAQQTLEGHREPVQAVAFSPDGKVVASGSWDGTVGLWDVATCAFSQTLEVHRVCFKAVAFSPDGKMLVSALNDGRVQFWDVATAMVLQTLEGHTDSVNDVAFSPDGKKVVSVSNDGTVRFWDATTVTASHTFKIHMHQVNAVAFSSDSKMVVAASNYQFRTTIRLWDAATGQDLQTLAHSGTVYSVAFSPDGKVVALGYVSETLLWDTATGCVSRILTGQQGYIVAVAFSPDGNIVASASNHETVGFWNAATGVALQTLRSTLQSYWPYKLSFSREGLYLENSQGLLYAQSNSAGIFAPAPPPLHTPFRRENWITQGGKNLLWLPPNYRELLAFKGNVFVFRDVSGQVIFINFLNSIPLN